MKKLILTFLIALTSLIVSAQSFTLRTNGTFTPVDPYLSVPKALYLPKTCDTINALHGGKDSVGAIVIDTCNHKLWIRDIIGTTHYWKDVSTSKQIDVFLVAGQSNAQGHGDSTLSPTPISGKTFQINSGILTPAKDPIGINIAGSEDQAAYGSAWPRFCNTYFNRTSHLVCIIPSSRGGTSQTVAGDVGNGNWDTTGVLFDSAVARVNNNMAALVARGYNPVFKGVLWIQGESDAIAYEGGLITSTDYTNAFKKMLRRFRTIFGTAMPFYVIQIGTSTTHPDIPYWQDIRTAQQSVANSDSLTTIVYYNARNFITRSLMTDNIHYNQVALNEVGQLSALAVTSNMKNIWQTQTSTVWYPQTIGIGAAPVSGMDIEVTANVNGNRGLKLLNSSTGSSATAMVRFDNDAGTNGFLWSTGTTGANNVSGPRTIVLYSGQAGGLRLVTAGAGDIVFSKFASLSAGSFGRFVNATGDYLYNTETDNASLGKFQINSTSWFNGLVKLYGVVAPPSTYDILVHSTGADSGVYKIPVTALTGNAHTISAPTTGGTVSLVNNSYNIINPAGTIAALTVNLPSSPLDNDRVQIKFTKAVTTVTYGNGTVVDGITSPIAGEIVTLIYDAGTTSWY